MIINGKEFNLHSGISIENMLLELNLDKKKVVVEVNENIISKEEFENFKLNNNDSIEVVSFVGGG